MKQFKILLTYGIFAFTLLLFPASLRSANLTDTSDSLSSSRLSVAARVDGTGTSAGGSTVKLKTTASAPFNSVTTHNLAVSDTVTIGTGTYTVTTVIDADEFTVTPVLASGDADDGDVIYWKSRPVHTITFTTASAVADGYFRFLLPADVTAPNDGNPDDGGFDFGGGSVNVTAADVNVGGGAVEYDFASGVATAYGGAGCTIPVNYHCFDVHYSGTGYSGTTITLTVGSGASTPIAPAPANTTEGTAEIYAYVIRNYNSSGTIIDQTSGRVGLLEPVKVTATVPIAVPSTPPGGDTIPPTPPILIRPVDDSFTSDPTPEFVWLMADDPNSNFVGYTLYLDGVAQYLGISGTGNSSGADYTSSIDASEIRLIPTRGIADGPHKWKVAAYDLAGNQSFSVEWDLTIDTQPPPIIVTDIDTHHDLNLSSLDPASVPPGTTFEVTGPKDIYFTIQSEIFTLVTLTFLDSSGNQVAQTSGSTYNNTYLYLYQHLTPGLYTVLVSATDRANLTTNLPAFSLKVVQAEFVIPIPGLETPITVPIPPFLSNIGSALYNYPATIARISTRDNLTVLLVVSLALAILLLIILLKKHYNLVLLNQDRRPLAHIPVIPITNKSYTTDRHGRVYLPGLGRTSELSITVQDVTTTLCLLHEEHRYTIILD